MSNPIQLDRLSLGQHAPATVAKTLGTLKKFMGFAHNVLLKPGPLTIKLALDGAVLAQYASFSLDVRCVPAARWRALARAHAVLPTRHGPQQVCASVSG